MVILLALMFSTLLHAGFEGFGSSTPGGNNGSQVAVTSLADSGPGTLREAIANANNRRIVFAVAGTINLGSNLSIRDKSFITIDGSTAPSPGITLQGRGLDIRNSHDVVITHIRIRNASNDGISIRHGARNVVIDHCSVTNSADGNIDITEDSRDVTVSWTIIGDTRPDWYSLHTKGMLIANFEKPPVTNISLHHNLFINEYQRSPQVSTAGLFDIRNNVIWDWGARAIRIQKGGWGNVINNVFFKNTNSNMEDAVVLASNAGPVYVHGNQGPGNIAVNALSTSSNAFSVARVTTHSTTEVEHKVPRGTGAFPRDAIDTLLAGPSILRLQLQSSTVPR
jgi:pectate lyase